jgi:mevalonate pyrophosphate decarboxylase
MFHQRHAVIVFLRDIEEMAGLTVFAGASVVVLTQREILPRLLTEATAETLK